MTDDPYMIPPYEREVMQDVARWVITIEPTDDGPQYALRVEFHDNTRDTWNPLPRYEVYKTEAEAEEAAKTQATATRQMLWEIINTPPLHRANKTFGDDPGLHPKQNCPCVLTPWKEAE